MIVTVEVQVGYEFDAEEAASVLAKFNGDKEAMIQALKDNSREVIQAGTGTDDIVVSVHDTYDTMDGGFGVVVYGQDIGNIDMDV